MAKVLTMRKKKSRDCSKCIAYYNMLSEEENKCGLGFAVAEKAAGGDGSWRVEAFPEDDECYSIELPKTKKAFVKTAESLGIDWNINEVEDF